MKIVRSTHTLVTVVIALVLSVLFAVGYFSLIKPNETQSLKYDIINEEKLEVLSSTIKYYAEDKNVLPESFEELFTYVAQKNRQEHLSGAFPEDQMDIFIGILEMSDDGSFDMFVRNNELIITNSYSKKLIEYKYENRDSEKFQLCTKFFKENKGEEEDVKRGSSSEVKHGSGDQCVDFEAKKKKTYDSSRYSVPQTDDELDEMTDEEYQQYLEDKYKSDSYDYGSGSQN